ncbi:hypothetical protein MBLNU13_g07467t1 [Cladosporium sp. NU13]
MSATDIQALLRFLSQDAKVPLATAISKVKQLQQANLSTIESISKIKIDEVRKIFEDEKLSKQVLSAAKRVSKKRAAGDDATPSSPKKRRNEGSMFSLQKELTPAELEASLKLPDSDISAEELADVVVFTNRAPLVLAFVVVLLKYTMPEQPLSSRLSLAQTYVSVTSRARAVSLGIENGQSAEELGMGVGQATVTIMGKELRVLKRWGYDWKDDGAQSKAEPPIETQQVIKDEKTHIKPESPSEEQEEQGQQGQQQQETNPPLWGLDLESLKKASSTSDNVPTLAKAQTPSTTNMPIHTPQAARAYLVKSFDNPPPPPTDQASTSSSKRPSAASKAADKERNLGMLLRALDLLYQSWIGTVGPAELDRRVWGWYIRVRPAVEQGVAGWGGKNEVKLGEILGLRRESR